MIIQFKLLNTLQAAILSLLFVTEVAGKFTWLTGLSTHNDRGFFGTKNVTASTNKSPSMAGTAFVSVDDSTFYYCCGWGRNSITNNLFKVDVNSTYVTWISGDNTGYAAAIFFGRRFTPSPTVTPGGRIYAAAFYDEPSFSYYVYGGQTDDFSVLGSMFKISLSTLLWSWESGSQLSGLRATYGTLGVESSENDPGARHSMIYFGNQKTRTFYVIGGVCILAQSSVELLLADVWQYSVVSRNWTWINGLSEFDTKAFFGDEGVTSNLNQPGSRKGSAYAFVKETEALYFFGGYGNNNRTTGLLNDLWRYDIQANLFTWLGGGREIDSSGFAYDKRNVIGPATRPRSRRYGTMIYNTVDNSLMLWGGIGFRRGGFSDVYLNDLWKHDLVREQWAWVHGTLAFDSAGSFGTQGVGSDRNLPPSKASNIIHWDSGTNLLYLLGGFSSASDVLNDLWKYSEEGVFLEDFIPNNLTTSVSEIVETTEIRQKDRTNFVENEPVTEAGVSAPLVIGVAGGSALVLLIIALIVMLYVRRNSYREAVLAQGKKSEAGDSTIASSDGRDTQNTSRKNVANGSSTLDLSTIKTPVPLVKYPFSAVQEAKADVPESMLVNGGDFDAVVQIGTQNGCPIYNGIAVSSQVKALSDKLTIKVFGGSAIDGLDKGIQDAFWIEASILLNLSKFKDVKIANLVGYSTSPPALIFPAYPLGTLEQYLQSSQLSIMDLFNVVFDVSRALKALHDMGYAHRNLKLRNVFVEKYKTIRGVLTGFGSLQRIPNDKEASAVFAEYRIDGKAANFVAPEIFTGLRGDVPSFNSAQILKSGDLFSLAILISKLLKASK